MEIIKMGRCDECLDIGKGVKLRCGIFICSRCLAFAVTKLVNDKAIPRHRRRRVNANSEDRSSD